MYNIFLTQYDGAILGPIAKLLGYILNGIYYVLDQMTKFMFGDAGVGNAGLCIVIFTFIVNALMIPLTIKQQKFSKLTSVMQPELAAIQKKYSGKKDDVSLRRMQLEQQEVYQKYGTSPTGGCLPLLISLPIILALYRVIQNVPAYVDAIKSIYDTAAVAIAGSDSCVKILSDFIAGHDGANELAVAVQNVSDWGDSLTGALVQQSNGSYNHIIDVLAQFRTSTWDGFIDACRSANINGNIISTIEAAKVSVSDVNGFLGLNIGDTPKLADISVLIPIFAIATQFINTKMLTSSTKNKNNADDPTAKTMSTMNMIMPFVSGLICLTLPIGIGIYWISSSLFRIVQQFFVNRHMEKIDVEELRQKNLEKAAKKNAKREQMGLPTKSLSQVANTKTSTISDAPAPKKKYEPKDYQSNENVNTNSISSIANMLNRKNND